MIPSPLRLEKYFFTKIHVEACMDDREDPGQGALTTESNCLQHKKDSSRWMVALEVRQENDSNNGKPDYLVDIEIVGLFTIEQDYPAEKADQLVKANAPALLYGSVRELVALLTGRGPFASVQLPSVAFVDEADLSAKQNRGRSTPRKKPAARQKK